MQEPGYRFLEVEHPVDDTVERIDVPGIAEIGLNETAMKMLDVIAIASKDTFVRKGVIIIRGSDEDREHIKLLLKSALEKGKAIDQSTLKGILDDESALLENLAGIEPSAQFSPKKDAQLLLLSKPSVDPVAPQRNVDGSETRIKGKPSLHLLGYGKPSLTGFVVSESATETRYANLFVASTELKKQLQQEEATSGISEPLFKGSYQESLSDGQSSTWVITTASSEALSGKDVPLDDTTGLVDAKNPANTSFVSQLAMQPSRPIREAVFGASTVLQKALGVTSAPPVLIIRSV